MTFLCIFNFVIELPFLLSIMSVGFYFEMGSLVITVLMGNEKGFNLYKFICFY